MGTAITAVIPATKNARDAAYIRGAAPTGNIKATEVPVCRAPITRPVTPAAAVAEPPHRHIGTGLGAQWAAERTTSTAPSGLTPRRSASAR